uniref:Uncharacterized protein n=1 Tax=Oryza glumipatula TaxID=40148 RepID=A0A0E0A7N1_9ORYZ
MWSAVMLNTQKGATQSSRNMAVWTYMLPNPSRSMFQPNTQKVHSDERQHAAGSSPQSRRPPAHTGSTTTVLVPGSSASIMCCCCCLASSPEASSSVSLPRGLYTVYAPATTGATTPRTKKKLSANSDRDLLR